MGGSVCRIKARQSFPAPVSTPGVLFVLSITDRTHWDREQRWNRMEWSVCAKGGRRGEQLPAPHKELSSQIYVPQVKRLDTTSQRA